MGGSLTSITGGGKAETFRQAFSATAPRTRRGFLSELTFLPGVVISGLTPQASPLSWPCGEGSSLRF
jgi:hypothetical protein